ncbi:MAG TPA: CBS domain-containing protein [Amycolatopsis sp.]|jgi:CBS domain-containing protein|nr:CBS domain-containing protein [Amycolatopsis sp.]
MLVKDIMSSPVIGVTGDATIEEAAALMLGRGFTTVPVFAGSGALIGLLTEADLGRARFTVGRTEDGPDQGAMTGVTARLVRQVMRPSTITVPAGADLAELATIMVETHLRCVPVVDGDHVVGIVSWRDLLINLHPR